MKQQLEIQLRQDQDAFEVQAHMNQYQDVKCYVVDCLTVRVWFNDSKITDKRVLKLIADASKQKNSRGRKCNVTSIKAA